MRYFLSPPPEGKGREGGREGSALVSSGRYESGSGGRGLPF